MKRMSSSNKGVRVFSALPMMTFMASRSTVWLPCCS